MLRTDEIGAWNVVILEEFLIPYATNDITSVLSQMRRLLIIRVKIFTLFEAYTFCHTP